MHKIAVVGILTPSPTLRLCVLVQAILRVYLDNNHERAVDVPLTPATSCSDVIDCCRPQGEEHCYLAELWRGCGMSNSLVFLLTSFLNIEKIECSFYVFRSQFRLKRSPQFYLL